MAALGAALAKVLETGTPSKGLARTRRSLEAELAASGLIALWSEFELPGQSDPVGLMGRAMIGHLETQRTPDARALIMALGVLELDLLFDALRANRRLDDAGVAAPRWDMRVGHARLEDAWLACDVFGDHDVLVGRYSYEGNGAHDLSVLVDHNILDIAKDMSVHRAARDLRSRWQRQPDIVVCDISAQEYSDRLTDALENLDRTWDPPISEAVPRLRALVESRMPSLPRPKPLKRRPVSQAARDRAYKAFRHSGPAGSLGPDLPLARFAIDYAADYYSDPLRWSPIAVELFLSDWLPRKVSLREGEVESLPTVLRAWLRFVGDQRGFEGRLVDELLAAVGMFEADYRVAMGDPARYGPAKSIAGLMQAEGVDVADQAAVQRWIDDFNARPQKEREALTGGPFPH